MSKMKIIFQEQKDSAPIELERHDDDSYRYRESKLPSTLLMRTIITSLVPSDIVNKVFGTDESQ